MIILEKPYVSDFLIETIKRNNFSVLDNEIARKYFSLDELKTFDDIKKDELFYSNSENSIDLIAKNMPEGLLNKMIEISKDKVLFREKLKPLYPDYYFKQISINEIKNIDVKSIPFPIVLKPSVGFLSFGVYPIKDENQWIEIIKKLDNDIKKFEGIFPKNVVNTSNFIAESLIEGEEYALDAYFDNNSEATILNIFHHPFFDENDVSDRVYYTSRAIIEKYLNSFSTLLDKIGQCANYKNFPFHLELRVTKDGKIIPIELNPMRFCGWCITDIANFCWGINVYEYYLKQLKPDWENILKNVSYDNFYFTMADIPSDIKKENIKNVDYDAYLKNIKNPLDIRKIDAKSNPVFAIVFAKTSGTDEIKKLLKLNMADFITV